MESEPSLVFRKGYDAVSICRFMVHDDRSWSGCDVNGVHGLSNGKRKLTLWKENGERIGVDTLLPLVQIIV